MAAAQIAFYYLSAVIVLSSLMVITRRNPVHSVLFMLFMFFHVAALYLFLNAEFFAAVQVIVYAGAILVMFLFVVLLLDLKGEVRNPRFVLQWPLSLVIAGTVLTVVLMALTPFRAGPMGTQGIAYIQKVSNIKALGASLYTDYIFPFEVASLILLVAMVGAIVLAKKRLKS